VSTAVRDPHDLTADLPAPRDDEPESLRRDIVDELRDHLACALHRELHHSRGWISADERHDAAEQQVLTRFGNPAAIARRLWWDAMKERVMAQRFTAIMAGIAAAACVAAGCLLWQLLQDSRAAQSATLAEMRDFNDRLLAQLADRPAQPTAEAANWAPVRVKLVSAADDAPIAGGNIRLSGVPFGSGKDASVSESEESGTAGTVELHSVPFGHYTLSVQAKGFRASRPVLVGPGGTESIVVRVPESSSAMTPRFDFGSPPAATGLGFLVEFWVLPLSVDGLRWESFDSRRQFLVEGERVSLVAQRYKESSGHDGANRVHFDLLADAKLPATPLLTQSVQVVHIVERSQDDEGEHVEVLALALQRIESRGETATAIDADGTFRVTLPDSFWRRMERAQVRLGLKPVPSGMRLVEISSGTPPAIGNLGPQVWIDVILNYQSSDVSGVKTTRLIEQVEIFQVQSDDATLDVNGAPHAWVYTVYLTDEQAEFIELAGAMHSADFVFVGRRAPVDGAETVAVDPELRERLKREASGEPPEANESGA
jgi:hypothetical protein